MTTKGESTRRRIVERSAPVFNTRGFFGASMSDLVRETGMRKGGIYNHFASKEELALEAFDYATEMMRARYEAALAGKENALDRLYAVVGVLGNLVENPPVAGGCIVMNTAIESSDAHPALKERAGRVMNDWLRLVGRVVKDGVEAGELSPGADPRETASVVVATLEGALMLSRLHEDPAHMRRAVRHLERHLASLVPDPGVEDDRA